MKKTYQAPQVGMLRCATCDIVTASINVDWSDEWSDVLPDSDQA